MTYKYSEPRRHRTRECPLCGETMRSVADHWTENHPPDADGVAYGRALPLRNAGRPPNNAPLEEYTNDNVDWSTLWTVLD